ncbi:MAG: metallophosphoesterase family protein, partial [Planctomycetota bacterium]
LDAVLAHAAEAGVERVLQMGDIVGYGPDPGYCIDKLREVEATICLGNHDAAVIGKLELEHFNPFAKQALLWTIQTISEEQKDFLASLPYLQSLGDLDMTLVHGSLFQPENFDYVRSLSSARLCIELQKTRLCFVGHTHQPCLFRLEQDRFFHYYPEFEQEGSYALREGERVLVNVGSVGQPRDEDPRAAYVLHDTEEDSLSLIRVSYDFPLVQQKIRGKGLPAVLAERLGFGL